MKRPCFVLAGFMWNVNFNASKSFVCFLCFCLYTMLGLFGCFCFLSRRWNFGQNKSIKKDRCRLKMSIEEAPGQRGDGREEGGMTVSEVHLSSPGFNSLRWEGGNCNGANC